MRSVGAATIGKGALVWRTRQAFGTCQGTEQPGASGPLEFDRVSLASGESRSKAVSGRRGTKEATSLGMFVRRTSRTLWLFGLLLSLVVFSSARAFALPNIGSQRPSIKLADGWDRELDLAGVKRPLLVLFAGKETSTQNDTLSAELAALDATTHYRRAVLEIGVAYVAPYNYWPARGIVKGELQKHSNQGVVVYADFTGQVATSLGVTPERANVILYGSDGKVLFSYAGAVPAAERKTLLDLIRAQLPLVARAS